jgi:hypothetical protein
MFDIDLDFGNRDEILKLIDHTPARLLDGRKHPSGIYVTPIPTDPFSDIASLDYKTSEKYGYFKIDFLNNSVYKDIHSNQEMERLLSIPPNWNRLNMDRGFVEQLPHIGNYFDTIHALPEQITSIEELAMFLAIIRPAKRHLCGLPWKSIAESVWAIDSAHTGYQFKHAHGIAYSITCTLKMALIDWPVLDK